MTRTVEAETATHELAAAGGIGYAVQLDHFVPLVEIVFPQGR